MDTIWEQSGWALPSSVTAVRLGTRLLTAALLGAAVGFDRETQRRAAGLRTHMVVSLGAATFVMLPMEFDATASDLAQTVKGIATGVGFLGAGAILKRAAEGEIRGLTTAGSIWVTAAVGMAAGAEQPWLALIAVSLSLTVLFVLGRLERNHRGR